MQRATSAGRKLSEDHQRSITSVYVVRASNVIYGRKVRKPVESKPTLIQADWDSEIMKDEIFGPLLPVLKFSNLKEAADAVKDRPKPLALYYSTTSAAGKDFVTRNISYGGGCINDTIVHLANPNIPFGGVGASGMSSYHGKESLRHSPIARAYWRRKTGWIFRYGTLQTAREI